MPETNPARPRGAGRPRWPTPGQDGAKSRSPVPDSAVFAHAVVNVYGGDGAFVVDAERRVEAQPVGVASGGVWGRAIRCWRVRLGGADGVVRRRGARLVAAAVGAGGGRAPRAAGRVRRGHSRWSGGGAGGGRGEGAAVRGGGTGPRARAGLARRVAGGAARS